MQSRCCAFATALTLVGGIALSAPPGAKARGVHGDFTGDGLADFAVFRPSTGQWFIRGFGSVPWGLPNDVPVPGDYDGDGVTDIAVYRRATGQWFIRGQSVTAWGALGDIPVPADYDGDGRTDVAVFRPSTGQWIIFGRPPFVLGAAGDIPVPGDYVGSGRAQPAVFRRASGTWLIQGLAPIAWGVAGDMPLPADYNGDRITDVAVYRPWTRVWFVRTVFNYNFLPESLAESLADLAFPLDVDGDGAAELVKYVRESGTWLTRYPVGGPETSVSWGAPGDIPVYSSFFFFHRALPGDFDGDRRADLAHYANESRQQGIVYGNWHVVASTEGFMLVLWGLGQDLGVPGDYAGLGRIQPAVYRNGEWFVKTPGRDPCFACFLLRYFVWGTADDVPVPADYDGDGQTDPAVFRSGTWLILLSSTEHTRSIAPSSGADGDVTLPGDYDGDGRADLTTFRDGAWRIALSSSEYTTSRTSLFGTAGDIPAPGDYDGDGMLDIAVFRPSLGAWYIRRSSDGQNQLQVWGAPRASLFSVPLVADFDGDGKTDFTVAYIPLPSFGPTPEWWTLFSVFNYTASSRTFAVGPPYGDPIPTKP